MLQCSKFESNLLQKHVWFNYVCTMLSFINWLVLAESTLFEIIMQLAATFCINVHFRNLTYDAQ